MIPGFDIRATRAYATLARIFAPVAPRTAPASPINGQVRLFLPHVGELKLPVVRKMTATEIVRRFGAIAHPAPARAPKATVRAGDLGGQEAVAYKKQLYKSFMFAHERDQVELAVSLLQEGIAPAAIEAAIAATSPAHRRGKLYELMAAVARPDIGSPPLPAPDPRSPGAQAAHMVRAYNAAIGAPR